MNDAHTQMHGRDSAPDLSVKLSPCLCSCPGWKMAAFSICVVTCMVCVPQPTTKSRVCCSLNTILHFCSIWIWSSLVCVVLVCEGWMAQTYCGKTVGKDGSMKVKTHQIQCTTVYNCKKQYFCCNLCLILLLFHIQLCIMHIVVTILFSILTHRIKVCEAKKLSPLLSPQMLTAKMLLVWPGLALCVMHQGLRMNQLSVYHPSTW